MYRSLLPNALVIIGLASAASWGLDRESKHVYSSGVERAPNPDINEYSALYIACSLFKRPPENQEYFREALEMASSNHEEATLALLLLAKMAGVEHSWKSFTDNLIKKIPQRRREKIFSPKKIQALLQQADRLRAEIRHLPKPKEDETP